MDWIEQTKKAVAFIEDHLGSTTLSPKTIAAHIFVSESHFTRAFHVLTGLTLSEYIRNRRLSEAANLIKTSNASLLEIALSLGYQSPEAFSKAFKRFHGVRPTDCKNVPTKPFYPLQIKLILTQEKPLNWCVQEKGAIYLWGTAKMVPNDDSNATAYLWAQCETTGFLDQCYALKTFETLVGVSISDGYTIKAKCTQPLDADTITIPPHTWAVFSCDEEGPQAILRTWDQIYSTWMPKTDYCISAYPQLEVYHDTEDGYHCEIWIAIA